VVDSQLAQQPERRADEDEREKHGYSADDRHGRLMFFPVTALIHDSVFSGVTDQTGRDQEREREPATEDAGKEIPGFDISRQKVKHYWVSPLSER